VGNAIDALPPTGGRLLIRTREGRHWHSGRKGLIFTVADTGEGMSEQTREKIFHPFFTTKGEVGNGLGLWVSQEIVARHEGSIQIRSRQGSAKSGTVFTFFLPAQPSRLLQGQPSIGC
jgi:signal transduction histidine kinase